MLFVDGSFVVVFSVKQAERFLLISSSTFCMSTVILTRKLSLKTQYWKPKGKNSWDRLMAAPQNQVSLDIEFFITYVFICESAS